MSSYHPVAMVTNQIFTGVADLWKLNQPSTHHQYLKLDKLTDFVTDVCILCHIAEESVIDVYGWISREEFFSCHKIQDFGYGGRATVEAMGLNPAGDLNGCEPFVNQAREENSF